MRYLIASMLCVSTMTQAAIITTYPEHLVIRRGSNSDQDLTVLSTLEQSGTADNWHTYREFYPDHQHYSGIFRFDVPEGVNTDAINGVELQTNYRGSAHEFQRWQWDLLDFNTRHWITIGNNEAAKDWEWSQLSFQLPGNPERFINVNGKIKLRYSSSRGTDASLLDYMTLKLKTPASEPPGDSTSWWQPKPGTTWQWQLRDTIDTSFDVAMYDIDLFDVPQATIDQLHKQGRAVVCYMSAGSWEDWRTDQTQFPEAVLGKPLSGWPGERWLDIRRLDVLGPIMQARLDLAASKGCDGVEPDNIDAYTNNSGFNLSANDQLVYNRFLAREAHKRGLSIGLKNDLDQVKQLVADFDWAINEQCYQYQECDKLLPFVDANKAVFGVEYQVQAEQFCPDANHKRFSWLKKNMQLDAWRQDCSGF